MSGHRRSNGFTLIEVQVAMIVLTMTVLGVMHLLRRHQRLAEAMEDFVRGNPVLHVVSPREPFGARAGLPAALEAKRPRPDADDGDFDFEVTVLSVTRTLSPPKAVAVVEVRRR